MTTLLDSKMDNNEGVRDDESVAAFKAWLSTKPAEGTYAFMSNTDCVYAQFLKETGRAKTPLVYGWSWQAEEGDGRYIAIDERLTGTKSALHAGSYGLALERLMNG